MKGVRFRVRARDGVGGAWRGVRISDCGGGAVRVREGVWEWRGRLGLGQGSERERL